MLIQRKSIRLLSIYVGSVWHKNKIFFIQQKPNNEFSQNQPNLCTSIFLGNKKVIKIKQKTKFKRSNSIVIKNIFNSKNHSTLEIHETHQLETFEERTFHKRSKFKTTSCKDGGFLSSA